MDQGSRWVYLQWDIPYDGNSDIMGYNICIRFVEENDSNLTLILLSNMGENQTSMFITTTTNSYNVTEQILPFMRYQFVVVACNELGCGDLEEAGASTINRTLPEG